MIRQFLFAAVLLLGAGAVRADVFNFSYAGSGVTASGTLTATSLGLGIYQVTGISGSRDGVSITASLGGSFVYSTSPSLTAGSFSFDLGPLELDSVSFGASDQESLLGFPKSSNTNLSSFSINKASLPEPSVWLLLLTMSFGVWALARKFPARKTR